MKNKLNLSGVSMAVIVRGIITVIAAVNIILGYLGVHLIPFTTEDVNNIVNGLVVLATAGVWAWGWWENNSLTVNAQTADKVLQQLNDGTAKIVDVNNVTG